MLILLRGLHEKMLLPIVSYILKVFLGGVGQNYMISGIYFKMLQENLKSGAVGGGK